ncbi:predicted protein [Meyerozyma guilliermondii ATCC 6260]|uniref:Uncharacterized protein n=1 Tax=Meyerozyma guilliermondii (strain ATCC 6260 / CBS 566 / DSM 6381 / JCM 1539 / NBRC 10279 / NRRL Y-324) TaxID=294746 RepID=A5DRK9_PICGU|nr:uncharacterized protein PGUG_05910 [Meyerozyma guilliermondii ATCC 6260]EDK41812.2 predicted protein [Meyerozyma guilliermondii ATCC 6260]
MDEVINVNEAISMLGAKVMNFGSASSSFSGFPKNLRSLFSKNVRADPSYNGIILHDLTAFTQMTSLTIFPYSGIIDTLKLPPKLLKLSITCVKFQDLERISFPPRIVDLKLTHCHITSTIGWLEPVRLKRLSLAHNNFRPFKAFLPCCEYLSLDDNPLAELEIEAPVIKHISLCDTLLASIPKLPDSLQVLIISGYDLALTHMSDLPPSLKVLDLADSTDVVLEDYTFPPSIQELNLGQIGFLKMSGVKFAKGSRLKELILGDSDLSTMDFSKLTTLNDRMIELPSGLKALKLQGMNLENIDGFTIPQSVTFLDLRENNLESFEVKSHIETLYLNENPIKSNFTVHEDSELRVFDLTGIGITMFSFQMVKAPKLAQLRLGAELEKIDLSNMPVDFQVLEHYDGGSCTLIQPKTGPESYIYSSLL